MSKLRAIGSLSTREFQRSLHHLVLYSSRQPGGLRLVRHLDPHPPSMSGSAQPPSGKPDTPPPAYSEYPVPQQQPRLSPNQSSSTSPYTPVGTQLPFPAHAGYGPTPIAQQTQLLPYYDPRSPYAVAEANARARWRFITALLWALVILGLLSCMMGLEVEVITAGGLRTDYRAYNE